MAKKLTDKPKKHNWVTGPNHKVVDPKANRLASDFINGCGYLTPAIEAELDALLAVFDRTATPHPYRRSTHLCASVVWRDSTVCEPDQDVLDAMSETPLELDELEPPPEAYEYDDDEPDDYDDGPDQSERNESILEARAAFEA